MYHEQNIYQPGIYGPPVSPQPHLGMGSVWLMGFSGSWEFITANLLPHSR